MTNITTVGVDLAKHSFSVCEMNHTGRVLQRRDLKRDQFAQWLALLPAGTIKAHITAILRKLQVQTRTQTVIAARCLEIDWRAYARNDADAPR